MFFSVESLFPYSLGDAIDWKLIGRIGKDKIVVAYPLLARGRDRLETRYWQHDLFERRFPYSLGESIDWKQRCGVGLKDSFVFLYSLGDEIDWKHF